MAEEHTDKTGRKQTLVHELRELFVIFVYLGAFFMLLRTYTHLVFLDRQIAYVAYALTLLKALAMAKVILTGETLRLSRSFDKRPLIWPTLYNTIVFSAFALAFEVVEHLVLGMIHGKSLGEAFAEILDKRWPHIVAATLVTFVAFLPFFAFRAMESVMGEGKLKELFFKTRESITAADEETATPRTGGMMQ
jgi:hypothetical protein